MSEITGEMARAVFLGSSYAKVLYNSEDNTIFAMNPAAMKLFGLSGSCAGKSVSILFDPKEIEEGLESHFVREDRIWRARSEGNRDLFIEVDSTLIEPETRLLQCNDITARLHQQNDLKHSEARFHVLAESLDVLVWVRNAAELQIEYINPAFLRAWTEIGYSLEDFMSDDEGFRKMVHPDDLHLIEHALNDPRITITVPAVRVIQKDGKLRYFSVKSFNTFGESGQADLFIGTAQDITHQSETELRLTRNAELLNHGSDAIIEVDGNHIIRFWNSAAEDMYGLLKHEVEGRGFREVLNIEEKTLKQALQTLQAEGFWSSELGQEDRSGQSFWVTARWNRYNYDGDDGLLLIHTDISDWKRLQAQFMRAQRLESIGNIASGMAHDLNNLLTPILMSADLLATDSEEEMSRMLGENIRTSARRGAEIIKQVLYFARGVDGRKLPIHMKNLLTDLQQMVKDTFPREIQTTFNLLDTPRVLGDSTQVQQVLLNLLVNARDAMPEGGRLTVGIATQNVDATYARMLDEAHPGTFVVVTIEDTGVGIPERIKDQIFEPFVTTKEMGSGTGLGLSTASAIVKSHGGFITFDSAPKRGTTFRVFFPVAYDDVESGSETPAITRPKIIPGKGELILFVDDEAAIVEIAANTLERHGFKVLTAGNGAEAVAMFARHKDQIRLVISDMSMPIMSGADAMKAIRAIRNNVPLIAMTGGLQRMAGLSELAVHGELYKPFNFKELLELTSSALEQGDQ